MNIDKNAALCLFSRWLDTELKVEALATVSAENFKQIKEIINVYFDELELTDDFIKNIWKYWFVYAAFNGTLVNDSFQIAPGSLWTGPTEMRVINKLLEVAYEAIDSIQL